MERKNELKDVMLYILAVCFLATGGIFARLSKLPPMNTAFYRVVIAIPILFIIVRKKLKFVEKKDVILILFGGVFFGIDLALWFLSFNYTSLANANLLANLTSFTIIPVSYFIFKEKVPSKFLLSVVITVIGVAILLNGKANPNQSNFFGDFIAFVASFFYAIFTLVVYKSRDRVDSMIIIFIVSFSTAITIFSIMMLTEGFHVPKTINEIWPLLGVSLSSQIIGQGLMSYSLGKVRASLTSVLALLQPVVAAILSFLIFSEKLTLIEIVGILITSVGIYYAKKTNN
ncbi:MAG: DMT family transporter [Tissierellia bacterium]|nr:DMT family transporter [Tissierellia bacterium]